MNSDSHRAAIKEMQTPAWGTLAFASLLGTCNIGAILLSGSGNLPMWVGFLFLTLNFHLSYSIVHEAVHGAIACKNPKLVWAQSLCGYVFAQFIAIPFTAHRKEHLAHHQNTNICGKDPDLITTDKVRSLLTVSPKIYKTNIEFYLRKYWLNAPLSEKGMLILELLVTVSWRISVGAYFSWETMIVLTVLPLITGGTWLAFLFAWLVHKPFNNTGRYVDTATYTFPAKLDGVITLLWGFQNYHSIHHLFPRVPFYRYRRVFKKIESDMIENQAPIIRVWQ